MLSDSEIRKLIEEYGFIENYVDLETQLQMCGFDLTLDYVEKAKYGKETVLKVRRKARPTIDFDNSRRSPTPMVRIRPHYSSVSVPGGQQIGEEWYELLAGSYVFHTAERVKIPADIGGILRVRSSLHRNSISFTSSCIDPGYYGHLTASLHIPAPGLRIMRGARFCQMLSWRIEGKVEKLYNGIYKEKKQ